MPNGTKEAVTPDLVQVAEFLRLLHGAKPPEMYFYIWHLDSKQSAWYADVEACIDLLHKSPVSHLTNLYTGVAWSPIAKTAGQRVRSSEVSGCSATWLDLDIAHAGAHKKMNLPPDIEHATSLVNSWAPLPSIEVFSGHGLQHWWRFDEPWIVRDDADRKKLQTFIQGWQTAIVQLFAAHGWQVDATHDLARVMRIPGTINAKPGCEPVLAHLITSSNQIVYDPVALMSRIEQAPGLSLQLTAPPERPPDPDATDYDALIVDPSADYPGSRLQTLIDVSPRFKAVWSMKGKGGEDNSTSGWDMAVACHVAQAGWKPQDIVNVLIGFRRLHKLEQRTDDYYRRTVEKAFWKIRSAVAQGRVNDLAEEIAQNEDMVAHQREAMIEAIKERLGVRIDWIKKYGEHPMKYVFCINGVESAPIATRGVLSYKSVEEAILETANTPPPALKLEHWRPVIQLLLHLVEAQPVDADLTPAAQGTLWAEEYIGRRQIVDDPLEALKGPGVLLQSDALHILSSDFRSWLTFEHREVKRDDITRSMLAMGANPMQLSLGRGTGMQRTFWRLPPHFRDADAGSPEASPDDAGSLI
jgi:hypothetical protein